MAYTRINWQDLPSTATPRNATNLNKMDSAIKEHDDKLLGNTSMGDVVVDSVRSKNMFGNYIILFGYLESTIMNLHSVGNNRIACIRCKPNTTYTISRSILTTNFKVGSYAEETLPTPTATATNYTIQEAIANNNGTTITYTTNATAKWLLIHFGHIVSDSSNIWESLKTIQVEEGQTQTQFKKYQVLDEIPLQNFYIRNATYVNALGYMAGWLVGKLFVMSVNFQIVDNTPNNTTLLSGLPRCIADRFVFQGALNNGKSIRLYVTKNGEICNDGVVYLEGASGWLNGLLVYPIEQ